MRDWRLNLNDIVACCGKVRDYTSGMTREAFLADSRTNDAVIRNLELIGEAAKQVPALVREQTPDIEWRRIAGMHDILAHVYFGIDNDVVWDVLCTKVKPLEQAVRNWQAANPP